MFIVFCCCKELINSQVVAIKFIQEEFQFVKAWQERARALHAERSISAPAKARELQTKKTMHVFSIDQTAL